MRMNVRDWRNGILSIFFIIALVGCGGGGGGGNGTGDGGVQPPPVADTTAPSVFITSPTGLSGYSTKNSTIDLAGSASDDQSLSNITWLNNHEDSGTAKGTTEWSISGIPLQAGDNVITVTAKDSAGNTATDSITITYNPYLEFLSTLQATPDNIFLNEATTIVFRIAIEDNPNLDASSVKLLKIDSNNNIIGTITTLADDGNVSNGDDIASDGVFSGKATFTESTEGVVRLRVSADINETTGTVTAYSEVFNLSVIAHLTDEEFSKAVSMPNETQQKYDELKATYGEEEAKTKTVEWLETQPEVTQAGISESGEGIWYVLDSGVLGGILLSPEGTKGGRDTYYPQKPLVKQSIDYKSNGGQIVLKKSPQFGLLKALSANTTNSIGSKDVIVISPFANQGGNMQLPSAAYDNIFNTFENSTCPTFNVKRIKDSNATVELFKTLNNYGVVVLDTHGDAYFNWDLHIIFPWLDDIHATQSGKVVFLTGEKATYTNKAIYEADLKKGRLAIIGGYYAITPTFVSYYNKSFPNTIFYSGSCRSMFNNSMASAFIGNGAKTYYGYTEYVAVPYDNSIVQILFDSLVNQGKTTGEAFNNAINEYNSSDFIYKDENGNGKIDFGEDAPAYFKIVGSNDLTVKAEGIINGTFEEGNINGWTGQGDVRIISQLGPLSPQEGVYMNIISTGLGSINDSDSFVEQTFCIPAGVTTLSFDYNVVSEEPMEFVGTEFDDQFEATLTTSSGTTTIANESINTSSWTAVSGIDFDGGDATTYMTGWKHITYDVSELTAGASVTLKFHTWDKGDSIYDTAALIDNVKLE